MVQKTNTHRVDLERLTGVATSRLESLSTTRVGVEVDARVSRRRGSCEDLQIPIIVPTGKGDHPQLGPITGVPEADDGWTGVSIHRHTHLEPATQSRKARRLDRVDSALGDDATYPSKSLGSSSEVTTGSGAPERLAWGADFSECSRCYGSGGLRQEHPQR